MRDGVMDDYDCDDEDENRDSEPDGFGNLTGPLFNSDTIRCLLKRAKSRSGIYKPSDIYDARGKDGNVEPFVTRAALNERYRVVSDKVAPLTSAKPNMSQSPIVC